MNILMIFIDGVGIGREDYEYNPFFRYGFKTFTELFGGIPSLDNPVLKNKDKFLFPTDAKLGIKGLPQSGTGQTSIFCGINAARFVGKHFGPYPYSTLIPVIKEKNIFLHFLKRNQKTFFANAYPKVFFDYINSGKQRFSVTSLSCRLSGMRLN
ncbi:MAG: metalloenzyme, partial [Ignavibacteriales bacterium]